MASRLLSIASVVDDLAETINYREGMGTAV